MSKRFKVWATTQVHVVRVIEAESVEAALDAFDGSVEATEDNRVKACDESNLLELAIDDEYVLCDGDEVIEVTS